MRLISYIFFASAVALTSHAVRADQLDDALKEQSDLNGAYKVGESEQFDWKKRCAELKKKDAHKIVDAYGGHDLSMPRRDKEKISPEFFKEVTKSYEKCGFIPKGEEELQGAGEKDGHQKTDEKYIANANAGAEAHRKKMDDCKESKKDLEDKHKQLDQDLDSQMKQVDDQINEKLAHPKGMSLINSETEELKKKKETLVERKSNSEKLHKATQDSFDNFSRCYEEMAKDYERTAAAGLESKEDAGEGGKSTAELAKEKAKESLQDQMKDTLKDKAIEPVKDTMKDAMSMDGVGTTGEEAVKNFSEGAATGAAVGGAEAEAAAAAGNSAPKSVFGKVFSGLVRFLGNPYVATAGLAATLVTDSTTTTGYCDTIAESALIANLGGGCGYTGAQVQSILARP